MAEYMIEAKVTAKSRVRSIQKLPDGTYKIKTPVAPEKGKANDDVVDILAEHLDIPKSCIELVSGSGSSKKRFKISA